MPDQGSRLTYKFERLREEIRQAVGRGEWNHRLPGERALARRFGANAKTVSKALTDLAGEGLLIREVGRGTFLANGVGRGHATREYAWICPADRFGQGGAKLCDLLAAWLESAGHRLSLQPLPLDNRGCLADAALSPARLRQLSGVIIWGASPCPELWAMLDRARVPVVLCNFCSEGIKRSSVMADFAQGVFELTEYLVRMGHADIVLLADACLPGVVDQALKGYHTALSRHHLKSRALLSAMPCADDSQGAVDGASGVVCVGPPPPWLLGERHTRSLAVMTLEGAGGSASGWTGYEVDPTAIAEWTGRLLLRPSSGLPAQVVVPGVFHDRGTVRSRLPGVVRPASRPAIL